MKQINPLRKLLTGLVLVTLLANLSCSLTDWEKERFQILNGELLRGPDPYSLRAVEAPQFSDPGTPRDATISFLNGLCSVGGNTVVVDPTFGPEGLDPEWVDWFQRLREEAQWRELGVLMRVPGKHGPSELEAQDRFALQIAETFRDQWDLVFWIDSYRPELTRKFQIAAGKVLVGSVLEGQFRISGPVPPPGQPSPFIHVGGIYAESQSTLGFVLPAGEESFRQLYEVFAPPRMNPQKKIAPTQLSPEEQQEGFSPLFDGKSFLGWALTGEPECWAVQDGEIRWLQPGGRYLLTHRRFKDFILRFEWKIEEGGNSGVFLRMPLAGRQSRIGMEFQLLGDYGEEPHENGTGSIYDVVAPSQNAAKPAGEWNTAEVVCDGPNFRAKVNGVQIQDTNLDNHPVLKHRLKEGFIGLQDHGHPVAFRNIRIKELG